MQQTSPYLPSQLQTEANLYRQEDNGDSALARLTGRLLYWCGFLYVLLFPFHLVLRSFTTASVVIAWKEILQSFGIVVLFFHLVFSRGKGLWNRAAIVAFFSVAMCLPSVKASALAPSLDTILLLIGPSIAGYFFFQEAHRLYAKGVISPCVKILFSGAVVAGLWIILGSKLGLERFVSREEEEWFFSREGIMRSPGTFDSPMSAGQYLWLIGTLAMAGALYVRKLLNVIVLFTITAACYIAVLYTASRGPYIIVGSSALMLMGAGLWTQSSNKGKKIGVVALISIAAIIVVASIIDRQTLETYFRIFNSSLSKTESSNAERNTRIMDGIHATVKYFPTGRGLEWYPVRNLVGTGLIYENTYLGLSVALGIRGIFIGLLYALFLGGAFVVGLVNSFKRRAPAALMLALSGPWLAYSLMYPQLQDRFSSMVSWCVIGASIGCHTCLKEWARRD